jgi:hypothetical protein
MTSVFVAFLLTLRSLARSRAALQLEVLALRHQLQVLERCRPQRLRLTRADRVLWVWVSRLCRDWRRALVIVKPDTVIAWQRKRFRLLWTWKSRRRVGRPPVSPDVRALIRTMSDANPLWGAPRIHGELLKLGIDVCQATVAKYMSRQAATIAELADVLDESPRTNNGGRFLRGPVRDMPRLVRPGARLRTSAGVSCTSPAPPVRLRPGRRNSCAKRFPGTRRHDIWSGIATTPSPSGRRPRQRWISAKSSRLHGRRGKTRTPNGLSGPSGGSASTTS